MAMPRARSAIDSLSASGMRRCGGQEAVRRLVAGHLAHLLGEDRAVFDPMSVAIDDRMF